MKPYRFVCRSLFAVLLLVSASLSFASLPVAYAGASAFAVASVHVADFMPAPQQFARAELQQRVESTDAALATSTAAPRYVIAATSLPADGVSVAGGDGLRSPAAR